MVDGKESFTVDVKRTVPLAFTASESFDVGVDLGSPVAHEYDERRPFRFDGKVERVNVKLKEVEAPMKHLIVSVVALACVALLCLPAAASEKLDRSVRVAKNLEPAIPRPEQAKAAADRLAALYAKTGKRPNIVWIVVDDMGYGDPGCYGGGAAIGAATPNVDKLAREGLKTDVLLRAADLHADALGNPDGTLAVPHGPDASDPGWRQDHQEPLGWRDQPADAPRRGRLRHRAQRQVARR